MVIVAGGVREELQRAFLLHRFRNDLGQPWMGLLITSLAFGLGHTLQGLDAAMITGTLGAIWGAMYLTRGSALALDREPLALQQRRADPCRSAMTIPRSEIYCRQDDHVGPAPKIGDPVGDQLGATRGDQPLADDRRRLLERPSLPIEFGALPRVGPADFGVGRRAGRRKSLRQVRLRSQIVAHPGAQAGVGEAVGLERATTSPSASAKRLRISSMRASTADSAGAAGA